MGACWAGWEEVTPTHTCTARVMTLTLNKSKVATEGKQMQHVSRVYSWPPMPSVLAGVFRVFRMGMGTQIPGNECVSMVGLARMEKLHFELCHEPSLQRRPSLHLSFPHSTGWSCTSLYLMFTFLGIGTNVRLPCFLNQIYSQQDDISPRKKRRPSASVFLSNIFAPFNDNLKVPFPTAFAQDSQ